MEHTEVPSGSYQRTIAGNGKLGGHPVNSGAVVEGSNPFCSLI